MTNEVEKSWWQRNWKWVVGVGCGGVVCMMLAVVVFAFGIISAVFGVIRSSDVYQQAVTIAREDAAVQAALGQPIEEGWLVGGSVETTSNSTGQASLSIPLSGPINSGTLEVEAEMVNGSWNYQTLKLYVDGESEPITISP